MRHLDEISLSPEDRPSVRTTTDADMRAAEQMALWIASNATLHARTPRWKFWTRPNEQMTLPLEVPSAESSIRPTSPDAYDGKRAEPSARKNYRVEPSVPPISSTKRELTPFHPPLRKGWSAGKKGLAFSLALLAGAGTVWELKTRTLTSAITNLSIAGEAFTARTGLIVKDILVSGRVHTSSEDILAALGTQWGDPILKADLMEARHRIEALPWVKQAQLNRQLSGTIHINIVERIPIAIWQSDGKFSLIDEEGNAIDSYSDPHYSLPLIVGAEANRHAQGLLNALHEEPQLMERIKAAVWVGNRRWNLVFDDINNGLNVRLPEEGTGDALKRLAAMDRDQKILDRSLSMIDLRLPDRMILGTTHQTMPKIPKPRKDRDA